MTGRYDSAYRFAWHCTAPPDLSGFIWDADSDEDDQDDYGNLVDYVQAKSETVDSAEVIAAAGGREVVLDSLYGGREVYGEELAIEDDWAVSWWKSRYPDGTPVYGFTHSGIEHVFEPIGYQRK